MKVNWGDTLKKWAPSEGNVQHLLAADIEKVIASLKFYFEQEKTSLIEIERKRALVEMNLDDIKSWDLLEDGIKQLGEHKQAWETHLEDKGASNNYVVEFPVFINSIKQLRYLKILFSNGAKDFRGTKILLFYHKPKEVVEVVYHE